MQAQFLLDLEQFFSGLRSWRGITLPPLLIFLGFFCCELYHILKLIHIGKDAPEKLWQRQVVIVVILAALTLISYSILKHIIRLAY